MARKIPTKIGRPLYSRKKRGYTRDLANLKMLRHAVLCDDRITTKQYARIVDALEVIGRVLFKFPTPQPKKAKRKR